MLSSGIRDSDDGTVQPPTGVELRYIRLNIECVCHQVYLGEVYCVLYDRYLGVEQMPVPPLL